MASFQPQPDHGPEPGATPGLQLPQVEIARSAEALGPPAPLPKLTGATQRTEQGGEGVKDLAAGPAVQKSPDRLGQGKENRDRGNQHQGGKAVTGPQSAQPVPLLLGTQALRGQHRTGPQTPPVGLQVTNAGLGRHDYAGTGHMSPPGEVQIFTGFAHARVETAQRPPQVGSYENGPARSDEDLARHIVLALVQFTLFDQGVHYAHPVGPHADGQQTVGRVPKDELRAGEPGVAPVSLFEQQTDGVGDRSNVVVTNQDVGRTLDHLHALVSGLGKAGAGGYPGQVGVGQAGGHAFGNFAVVVADSHHQDRKLGVVLVRQGPQRFLQPGSRPTGHDHCHHGGCARLSHHQRSRA